MNLDSVRAALAAIPDRDLGAFSAAAEASTDSVGGLFAWLEHAAGWEIDRRAHRHYPLREPMDAMEDAAIPDGLLALAVLEMQFRHDADHEAIAVFLKAAAARIQPTGAVH